MKHVHVDLILRNHQFQLISHIEIIYKNLPKSRYFKQRFDKKYIVDLTRKQLKKRQIFTQWSDDKLYEFSFNAIEFINITLPEFRNNLKKTGIHKEDIARMFNYKTSRTLLQTSAKYHKIRSINMLFDAILTALN